MEHQAGNYKRDESEETDELEEVVIGPDMQVFTTGVVCKLLGIPVWVLKQLDSEGIVCPARENEMQARLYSKRHLKVIKHCWYYLQVKKVKIQGLKVILELEERYGDI